MSDKKKVFLVDALALIYRAHFAFINNPRINSKGMNTSAIFGFLTTLLDTINKEKPGYLAVAFDSYEPTTRVDDFSDYKANRDKQPEDITLALPVIKELLDAFHIPVLERPGYEADDIVATLSKKIPEKEFHVFMLTPDKDYAQLVRENVFLFKPGRKGNPPELWDVDRVKAEFGIERVEQVVEIQGLMGDAVDNIPGVPGIGPKTAQKLIAEFDNIDNLLQNTDKLKGKVKESLEENREKALMSRELARLITDVDVEFNEDEFRLKDWDKKKLETLFAELEFKGLGKRVLGHEPVADSASENEETLKAGEKKADFDINDFTFIEIEETTELKEALDNLAGQEVVAINFVFNSDNFRKARPVSVALASFDKVVYHYIFPETPGDILPLFSGLFTESSNLKICYDLKFLLNVLAKYGSFELKNSFDTRLAQHLLEPEGRSEIDYLAQKYLDFTLQPDELFGDEKTGTQDARTSAIMLSLYKPLSGALNELDMMSLANDIEFPLSFVLADMEQTGVRLDIPVLSAYSVTLKTDLDKLEQDILQISGVSFNLNSPQQLGHVLFDILKLDPNAKKTKKSKQYVTNEEVLKKLAAKHKIAELVLDYREIQKLKSTYVDALPQLVDEETGKLHTTYDQAGTATGRLSSKNPNLQNIPIRTERGRFIRKAFIPSDAGRILISADYSQIELRIIAHSSNDTAMIDDFVHGFDIHQATAARVFNVSRDEVKPGMRRKAKEVNFGIIYGISSWGLSQRLGITRSEGSEIKKQYFEKYPGIKNYMDQCIETAREKGYAETLMKRRRYLRDINSRSAMQRSFAERNAINAPIQGSAADLIKMAMVRISNEFQKQNIRSKMILQVHDELVVDTYLEEKETVVQIIKYNMEHAMELKVPLVVEIGRGNNWLEAH